MKKKDSIKILFLLWAYIGGLWGTQEVRPLPDALGPLRLEQFPELTPRRPLITCLWGEPTDNPPIRPPLNTQEPLLLNQNGSGNVVSRLGENPPLVLTERPGQTGRYLADISNNTFSQEFSAGRDRILADQGGISSQPIRNEGAILDRWQGGNSSPPVQTQEYIVDKWKDEATSKIPSQERQIQKARIPEGRIRERLKEQPSHHSISKEDRYRLEETQKTEKFIPQKDLKVGKEAISKNPPKIMEKNIERMQPKIEKKIQVTQKTLPKEISAKKPSFKKPVVKKNLKSTYTPKKIPQKVIHKDIPRKTYLNDLKKKYDEGFAEGQKHPDCSMCKLPEYLR